MNRTFCLVYCSDRETNLPINTTHPSEIIDKKNKVYFFYRLIKNSLIFASVLTKYLSRKAEGMAR